MPSRTLRSAALAAASMRAIGGASRKFTVYSSASRQHLDRGLINTADLEAARTLLALEMIVRIGKRSVINLPVRFVLGLFVLAGIATFPAPASADTFGSSASTGVADNCNLAGVGGSQTGGATAVAPEGKLVESCGGSLINADATASAGIAQGNVTISGGAYVLGSLHASGSASGPSRADGRAIFFEQLVVAPTIDFSDFAFDVIATYTFDGNIMGQAQAAGELQTVSAIASFDQSATICTFDCGACPPFGCTITVVTAGEHQSTIMETIPVLTSSPFLSVQTTLDTFAGSTTFPLTDQPGAADFSSTGILSLTLPPGFTFASDVNQGVLGGASAVPEPGTWALLIVGVGVLGLVLPAGFFRPKATARM